MLWLPLSVLASDRNPAQPLGGPRNIIAIDSVSRFCMFLPPAPGISVAQSEGYPLAPPEDAKYWAVSYCTDANSQALGHKLFPDGVITGAHLQRSDVHVQITGTWNPKIMGIPLDGGGYYDLDQNVNSPPGGICAGYDSFYNNVNPIDGIYCIKCCKGINACNIQNGEKGCSVMVPGDYSSGFDGGIQLPRNDNITVSSNPSSPQSTKNNALALGFIPSWLVLLSL